jgi:hypothetical protein
MRKRRHTPALTEMNADELAEATAEFDREFVADEFGPPDSAARARLNRARRKRGRPVRGRGAKAISVTVELSVLKRTDALAKKLRVTRAQLIERGLRAVLRHHQAAQG